MSLLFGLFLFAGLVTFLFLSKLGIWSRLGISFAVFVIPSIIAYVWIARVGDKPLPGSAVVDVHKNPESK